MTAARQLSMFGPPRLALEPAAIPQRVTGSARLGREPGGSEYTAVAQSEEHPIPNRERVGSKPACRAVTPADERDAVLERHETNRSELIAIATGIAHELAARDGSTCVPRVLLEMRARGHGDLLDAVDPRWSGNILLKSKGWIKTGEEVPERSHAALAPMWRRA